MRGLAALARPQSAAAAPAPHQPRRPRLGYFSARPLTTTFSAAAGGGTPASAKANKRGSSLNNNDARISWRDCSSMSSAPDAGRVLFVGGVPWDAPAANVRAALRALCPRATHVDIRDPHRGWALVAFRSVGAANDAAAAIRAATAAAAAALDGDSSSGLGARIEVAPAQRVPAGWPAERTMSEAELAAAAAARERADRHHAHLKRRRARQKDELLATLAAAMEGLAAALPGDEAGGEGASSGLWGHYTPLLRDLAGEWASLGGGSSDTEQDAAATQPLLARLPPRLSAVLRPRVLERALREALPRAAPATSSSSSSRGPITLDPSPAPAAVEAELLFDWSRLPAPADPALGGLLADADVVRAGGGRLNLRALRKRVQVEGFALALVQLLPELRGSSAGSAVLSSEAAAAAPSAPPLVAVDAGSGGGNLALPLAWLFGGALQVVAVDIKPAALEMVKRRAQALGLWGGGDGDEGDEGGGIGSVGSAARGLVTTLLSPIEDYAGPADAVLALHACGAATDRALQLAAARRAAFVVSPCCIGKVNLSAADAVPGYGGGGGAGGGGEGAALLPALERPRSAAVRSALARVAVAASASEDSPGTAARLFAAVAAVADYSHAEGHGYPELAAEAKAAVELDRTLAAREAGCDGSSGKGSGGDESAASRARLARLPQPQLTAKSDVLLGRWPRAA